MFCPIRKIIFTHPPKCGGTSFEHFLGFKNYGEHCRLYKHASLVDHVKAIEKINQNADDFAKISIIRNPWERMVSWYFHLREKALFAERFGKLKNRIQSLASDLEFNEFVDCINKFNIEIFHRDFSYYMFGESNTFEIDLKRAISSNKVYQAEVRAIVKEQFEEKKAQLIENFEKHPVTQEISNPNSSNISNTLGGYGNLYGFLGFEEDDPTSSVEEVL